MREFWESPLGQIIARNGILAVLLAYSLWANRELTERLFALQASQVEVNTKILKTLEEGCRQANPKKEVVDYVR